MSTLIDTNIFIDILGKSSPHRVWSLRALEVSRLAGPLILSSICWSELAASPLEEPQLTAALGFLGLIRETVSFEAAFLAGKAHRQYRLNGGLRDRTLPDFLIGAQADIGRYKLLTRDPSRYARYFPGVPIISPETFV